MIGIIKDPAFDWWHIQTVSNKKEEKHMDAVSYAKSLGYYISTGEFGIKALSDGCFALLYIPYGAIVHVEGDSFSISSSYYRSLFGLMLDSKLDSKNVDGRWADGVKETRKHRANKAYVVAVCKSEITRQEFINEYTAGETFEIELKDVLGGRSIKDAQFKYISDSWVSIDDYSIDGDDACDTGIHYFPGCEAAIKYHIDNTYAGSYFTTFGFMPTKDPYADSKCELAEEMLPKILPDWIEHKTAEFKCIHYDVYECSYDHEGKTLFDQLTRKACKDSEEYTSPLSEAFKEINDAARELVDKFQSWTTSVESRSDETTPKPFERAYLCKRVTGQKPNKSASLKHLFQQNNIIVNIGCNIYNGIPVEDEEETEEDDDKPP